MSKDMETDTDPIADPRIWYGSDMDMDTETETVMDTGHGHKTKLGHEQGH